MSKAKIRRAWRWYLEEKNSFTLNQQLLDDLGLKNGSELGPAPSLTNLTLSQILINSNNNKLL